MSNHPGVVFRTPVLLYHSQCPVIDWAGQPVRSFNISLRNGQVTPGHIKCAVPEHPLQSVRIAAITQILNGKGMAKSVDRYPRNAGPLADLLQELEQPATRKRPPRFHGK